MPISASGAMTRCQIRVERFVGNQGVGLHAGKQMIRALEIMCLPACEEEADRIAECRAGIGRAALSRSIRRAT